MAVRIVRVDDEELLEEVRGLLLEFADALGHDLCFQGFAEELENLPGKYAPPDGRLLVALSRDRAAGCVALRKLEDGACEMKRLYVRPEHRGSGLGARLVREVLSDAREIGYARICLDTLAEMESARAIYRAVGFEEIEPYYENPIPGAVYMGLALDR